RHFKRYAQVSIYKAKLFNSLSQGDHAWHDDVLEVSERRRAMSVTAHLFPSPIAMQLELGPDMAKVRRALNIPLRFREWRWLLSEYWEEDGGLPLPRMSKGGSRTVLTLMICLADRKNVLLNLSQRERLLPNLQEVKLLLRTQRMDSSGVCSSSSARVKHLVGADSTKVGGMRGIRGVLPEPPADTLENHDMFREAARARPSSAKRQRDADIPPRSSSRLHRSNDGDRNGRSAYDPALLTLLEMRLAEAKKMRESSARVKGSSSMSAVGPKVNKPSSVGDACVSDLLKTNFLSNPSSCAELNSSADAPSSVQLSELEKKNAELASQLSAEQARYEKKTSDLRVMISGLKSSLIEKDSELNSSAADLASRKDTFFRLEHKNADISLGCDKLLARFHVYHKSAKESKSEVTIDAYKLGYLHCADGTDSLYAIDDVDIEMLCPNSHPVEGGTEEQADGVVEGVAGQVDVEEATA
ncbi:hypothetical protein Prudu_159S000600, partial [Prunus dulcis]